MMKSNLTATIGLQAFFTIGAFVAVALSDERKLYQDIFADYEVAIRPRNESDKPVNIALEFELTQIKELEEKSEILSTIGFVVAPNLRDLEHNLPDTPYRTSLDYFPNPSGLNFKSTEYLLRIWHDDYLKWNPGDYGNITELVIPPDKIWLPDFGIQNSAETFYDETYFQHFRVGVNSEGEVTWSFGGVFHTSCELDTTFYPFDIQSCSINFENWMYDKSKVDLHHGSKTVHLHDYHKHGIWKLVGTRATTEVTELDIDHRIYPTVKFELQLKRKSRYYIVNMMVPCAFLTLIALLVYLLPPDSGEKVSLGVTILLAFSVFQFVVAEHTPVNSDHTPLLSIFMAITMGLSTLSVVTTVFVLQLHHHGAAKPVPSWLRRVVFRFLSRILCIGVHESTSDNSISSKLVTYQDQIGIEHETSHVTCGDDDGTGHLMTSKKVVLSQELTSSRDGDLHLIAVAMDRMTSYVEMKTSRLAERDRTEAISDDWKALAKVVDHLLFNATIVGIILAFLWLIVYGRSTPEHDVESE